MTAVIRFDPATTSFGDLTLQHAHKLRIPAFNLDQHRRLIVGWIFSACFLAGLGSLYMLDRATFEAEHLQPVSAVYLVDYD